MVSSLVILAAEAAANASPGWLWKEDPALPSDLERLVVVFTLKRVLGEGNVCTYLARNGLVAHLGLARELGFPVSAETCAAAARGGHFGILKWLRQPDDCGRVCPLDKWTCANAALIGRLDILEWVYELCQSECLWSEWACAAAAKGGHIEVLKWLRSIRITLRGGGEGGPCPWNEWSCALAAAGGQLQALKWLRHPPAGDACPWNY